MEQKIGENISRQRQNRKMTQEEFAFRLGVTPQAVSKWERGLSMPDVTMLEGICRTLQTSANELLGMNMEFISENSDTAVEMEMKNNLFAEPLMIEIGEGLIPVFVEGLKTDLVDQKRKELAKETGMLLPILRIRDSLNLKGTEAVIRSYDKVLWRKEFDGQEMEEDVYQLLIGQIVEECRKHYGTILNKQLVKTMIDYVKELYPGVADGLVPEKISYLELERRLQKKIREDGTIRDIIHILEELEEGHEPA